MLVSIVIPARSWDRYLTETVASIARQDLPPGVGVETVIGLADVGPGETPVGVTVVANPTGTIPDALNRAIAASSGDVVVRVDARCVLQPDHIVRVLAGLEDPSVGCVGGAALVLDRGLFGSTYAVAFNSPLLGPTVYRYRRTSGAVDAAYLGARRRSDLEALGGFDSRLIRNQDNELADRVRASGKSVYYDADLVIGYHNARGLQGAVAHHHEFGLWRMIQRSQGQRALTGRHVVALTGATVAGAAGMSSVVLKRTRPFALGLGASAYLVAGLGAWRTASQLRRARPDIQGPGFHPAAPVLAPALAGVLDGAWIAGLVRGAWRARRASVRPASALGRRPPATAP